MKKLLLILFLFTGYTTFAQGKIGGEGNVIPTGNYPIVASKDIKGTLHTFKTIVQRDALPANYKDTGMLAYVVDSLKYYKWNGTDWEEFKTGSDAPTDYFTSYAQAPDSSYLQTNRKDGTKQYVVIQADGLVGVSGGGGGDNSLTWEQTLQNQGEIAFTTDNTVDFGSTSFTENFSDSEGSTLSVQKNSSQIDTYVGNADKYGDIAITADGVQSGAFSSDDSKQAVINLLSDSDSSSVAMYSISDGEGHRIDINPSVINIYPVNRPDLNLKIDGLDSSNANPNNIAWFDENNILHRGALTNSGSGTGINLYNTDSSLAGDRVVNLNGHSLLISSNPTAGIATSINVNAKDGEQSASISSSDGTGFSAIGGTSSSTGGYSFTSLANNGTNTTQIQGDANANSIAYTAGTHTFQGTVNIGGVNYPTSDGTANQVLTTDGSGNASWEDASGNIKTIDSTVTLSSGTITVSDSRVHTGAKIFLSVNTPSGTQGFLSAKTSDIVDGTSFIINSTSATDNSTVNYEIINP